MKLHAFDLPLAMTQTHDDAVFRRGRNLQTLRQRLLFHNQRMITSSRKVVAKAGEYSPTVVTDLRSLAMHQFRRTDHASAKRLPDRLMAQAHAEQRYPARETIDHFERNTGAIRRSRSR